MRQCQPSQARNSGSHSQHAQLLMAVSPLAMASCVLFAEELRGVACGTVCKRAGLRMRLLASEWDHREPAWEWDYKGAGLRMGSQGAGLGMGL